MGQLADLYRAKADTRMRHHNSDNTDQGEQFGPAGSRHTEHPAKCKCSSCFVWGANVAHDKAVRQQRGTVRNFLAASI